MIVSGESKFKFYFLGFIVLAAILVAILYSDLFETLDSTGTLNSNSIFPAESQDSVLIPRPEFDSAQEEIRLEPVLVRRSVALLWKSNFDGKVDDIKLPERVSVRLFQSGASSSEWNLIPHERQGHVLTWTGPNDRAFKVEVVGFLPQEIPDQATEIKLKAGSQVWFKLNGFEGRTLTYSKISGAIYKGAGYAGRYIQFWSNEVPKSAADAVEVPDSTPVRLVVGAISMSRPFILNIVTKPGEKRVIDLDLARLVSLRGRLVGLPDEWVKNRRILGLSQSQFAQVVTNDRGEFAILSTESLPTTLATYDASGAPSLKLVAVDGETFGAHGGPDLPVKEYRMVDVTAIRILNPNGSAIETYAVGWPGGFSFDSAFPHPGGLGLLPTEEMRQHDSLLIYFSGVGGIATYEPKDVQPNEILTLSLKMHHKLRVAMKGAGNKRFKLSLKGALYSTVVWSDRLAREPALAEFVSVPGGEYTLSIVRDGKEIVHESNFQMPDDRSRTLEIQIPARRSVQGRITNWDQLPAGSVNTIRLEHFGYCHLNDEGAFELGISNLTSPRSSLVSFGLACGRKVEGPSIVLDPEDKNLDIVFPMKKTVKVDLTCDFGQFPQVDLAVGQRERPKAIPRMRWSMRGIKLDSSGHAEFLVPTEESVVGLIRTQKKGHQIVAMFATLLENQDHRLTVIPKLRRLTVLVHSEATEIMYVCPIRNSNEESSFWAGRFSKGESPLDIPSGCHAIEFLDALGNKKRVDIGRLSGNLLKEPRR